MTRETGGAAAYLKDRVSDFSINDRTTKAKGPGRSGQFRAPLWMIDHELSMSMSTSMRILLVPSDAHIVAKLYRPLGV